ncbi:uncharacterized protein LOC111046305 [Nilaparvata lugens]|uniref:uncharacterized protein LOC111046305 n=1 Tax=Nilaparvata lugens TaxID=108931 RepID=UPI00193D9965|nr:uncharacterized protein LOC111046305 [Nilaparvata lugens]
MLFHLIQKPLSICNNLFVFSGEDHTPLIPDTDQLQITSTSLDYCSSTLDLPEESVVDLPVCNLEDIIIQDEPVYTIISENITTEVDNDTTENHFELDEENMMMDVGCSTISTEIQIPQCDDEECDIDDPDYVLENNDDDDFDESDYVLENNENSDSKTEDGTTTENENTVDPVTKKRKGICNRNEWKRYKMQALREKGKSYIGRVRRKNKKEEEVEKKERKMGPRCKSSFCKTCKKRFCPEISDETRKEIFTHFWSVLNWDQRRACVASLVDCIPPKQKRRIESGDRRGATFHYFLKVGTERKEVCREMFCNTFALGVWSVKNWAKNVVHGMNQKLTCNNPGRQVRIGNNDSKRDFVVSFVNSIPKTPSHYCRKDTGKLYLENSFHSEMELYRLYKAKCDESGNESLSRFTFNKILCEMNVALFQPRKDQCDKCCQYKVGNLSEELYGKHVEAKDQARKEKENDKRQAAENKFIALCVDVQAVKLCPFLKASAVYFKTKLCNHNYTVYNLNNSEVDCYWWSEVEGELKSSNFTSLLIAHLKELISNWNPSISRIIKIWSDGCGYQNRNKVLSNALLNLAVETNFTIHQKYLHVGHTQMEVDSVHATIERRLANREVYLPSDYVSVTREARLKPFPYRAHSVTFDFFKDYTTNELYPSIRPGKKVSDPTVNDVCEYLYLPTGEIKYKLHFDEEFQVLPRRPKSTLLGNFVYPDSYKTRIKIADSKWEHLQQLKAVIPKDVHSFYDLLPH